MITEIKKGDRFRCAKSRYTGVMPLYFRGREYVSENNGCITDNSGSNGIKLDMDVANKHFTKLDEDTEQDLTREAIEQDEVERSTTAQINWNKITENYNKVEDLIKERTAKSTATFQSITASLGDLLAYKNAKYGNSALEPLNIFGNKSKVGQRLDDKLSRVQNSPTLRKNDVADIIGYLILVCQENNWTNFDEFKD